MALIELRDVTYTYPAVNSPALQNLNLQVNEGEIVALVGANGAGKSTLCHTLAGFIPHFYHGDLKGTITVAGADTHTTPLSELVLRAGLVFQNPFSQISGSKFTVYEEIAFGLENIGLARDEMKTQVEKALALTGITELAERSPYALSGGQQQRVALASILAMQPKVLILDEPTSQLDPIGTREVFQVIKTLSRQGVTIVMAEHKVEWIAEFADRVVALSSGSIILQGKPGEVLASPLLPEHGIGISRYTSVARRAQKESLWPEGFPLPITLAEAQTGFSQRSV
ncbi:MAG: ABC transporter ATP-binding protein [Chloroflexi bacterium]|nr:ABC transporter ATP-binding protein [Chloroflexota bacterium]